MTLEELYTNLSLGVLSNLIEGDEGSGNIPYQFQNKVVNAINQGLLALHSRFILSVQEVQIRAYDQMTIYPLQKKFADQDPTVVPQKFISDSLEAPFQQDVLKILEIYDEEGKKLKFDEPGAKIYTPNPTTLQLVEPVTGNTYFVIYQAQHPKLASDDLATEITLPDVLVPALEAHVAYSILTVKNGQEHAAKAAEWMAKFAMVCEEVENKDLVSTSLSQESTKLHDRGFV